MIEARGLTKIYGNKLAVNDLSFSVRPGRVTGFLGPNGSGKSTTMRMLVGLDAPDSGAAKVNGRSYQTLGWPLREVGALLEAKAIHPGRSARGHLWMLAQTHGIKKQRVDEVLDLVGLNAVADQRAGKFSLGMSQRLGIAAALLGDPGVLLFDEPINGLDPDGIRWVRNLLRNLASQGRTVFVSSHLMSEMALTAEEVVVIGKGTLITQALIEELTGKSSQNFVRVRSPESKRLRQLLEANGAATLSEDNGALSVRGLADREIGDLSTRAGIVLYELSQQTASLEDAYMELTEQSIEYRGDGSPAIKEGVSA